LALLEDMMWRQGGLRGGQMAGAFSLLHANDLIWSRMIHRYLMGEAAAFDAREQDAYGWLAAQGHVEGSWWLAWAAWLASHSGPLAATPVMRRGTEALRDAPGSYILQRQERPMSLKDKVGLVVRIANEKSSGGGGAGGDISERSCPCSREAGGRGRRGRDPAAVGLDQGWRTRGGVLDGSRQMGAA